MGYEIQIMEKTGGRNQTPNLELILLGFGNGPELQPLLFLLFLMIYIVAVAANLLIVVLVVADVHLHTPMYYFVANLSTVEICYVSTTLPRLIGSLVTGDRNISLQNCFVQFDFYIIFANAESLLLTAMCIDRYLAICHPLRYPALMNGRVCCHMVASAWIFGISYTIMLQIFFLHLTYCGPKEIDLLFCDFGSFKRPFCGAIIMTMFQLTFAFSIILNVGMFLLTLTSYFCIIVNILRIPSSTGRQKTFSTCSSHLIVVLVFYVSVLTVYVVSAINPLPIFHKIMSVWFLVLVPLLNPVLYCLRNKEVQQSLRKALLTLAAFRHRHGV
nr:olfactory receptor 10C1-like [Pelodiscus sinensis]|eukprot:XP_006110441.1 olfactory receptor 10C1-like [Pelodiscus sinensis]